MSQNQRDGALGRELAWHDVNLDLTLGILDGPLSTTRSDSPEYRVRSNPWAPLVVIPKQANNQKYKSWKLKSYSSRN